MPGNRATRSSGRSPAGDTRRPSAQEPTSATERHQGAEGCDSPFHEVCPADREQLIRSLRNCLMLARLKVKTPPRAAGGWDDIIRFCAEAGIVPNILRGDESDDGGAP